MEYHFKSNDGMCPELRAHGRKWYIKDRWMGGEDYRYCLMSVPDVPGKVLTFKNKLEVATFLGFRDGYAVELEDVADDIINRRRIADFSEEALLEKDGVRYRYSKKKNTLTVLKEPRQETEWCNRYLECLELAKEIIKNVEEREKEVGINGKGQVAR